MEDRSDGTVFINGEPHAFVMKDVHLTPEQEHIQLEAYRKIVSGKSIKINVPIPLGKDAE